MALVPGEFGEKLHHLVPDHRVQAAGGLIQNQKPWLVGQGHRNAQLHLHTPGKVLELLALRQVKAAEILPVGRLIPVFVGQAHHVVYLTCVEALGKAHLVQHNAGLLPGEHHVLPVASPQEPDAAAVPLQHIQNQADGGGLSGPVFPDQAHDAALGQAQVQRAQVKARIALSKLSDFNGVHVVSSSITLNISIISSRLSPQAAARSRISCRRSSICRRFSSRSSSVFFAATKQPLPATV